MTEASGRTGAGWAGRRRVGDVDRHIAARVRERRILLGLTQQQAAELIGIPYQQLHKYEAGVNRIPAARLYQIAQVTGVEVGHFYEGLEGGRAPEPGPQRRLLLELARAVAGIPDPGCAPRCASSRGCWPAARLTPGTDFRRPAGEPGQRLGVSPAPRRRARGVPRRPTWPGSGTGGAAPPSTASRRACPNGRCSRGRRDLARPGRDQAPLRPGPRQRSILARGPEDQPPLLDADPVPGREVGQRVDRPLQGAGEVRIASARCRRLQALHMAGSYVRG